MIEQDLYIRKTREKMRSAKDRIFRLQLRAANSPYDIDTAYPHTFKALKSKLNMFKRHIEHVEEDAST